MNILKKLFGKQTEQRDFGGFLKQSLDYSSSTTYNNQKAMLLSTVYRCVEVISDSVAQLPIYVYKQNKDGYKQRYTEHPTYYLLNKEPNERMSRFTLIKSLVTSMLLNGNGYAYIKRDGKGAATGIYFIKPEYVTINYDSVSYSGEVSYTVTGIGRVDACNMIHLLNFSYDGIIGISTLKHARNTLTLAHDAETHARGFFESGAAVSGVLKVNNPLTAKQKQDIRDSWSGAFGGNGTPNGIAVLEGTMDFQSISVNPSDAQLLETRQFNVIDICRFFGVSPVKAFDLSKSSYSTVEATQLSFLTDTIAPLLEKIELEFERKLYLPSERKTTDVKFDTSVLLRADKASQADYYQKLFNIGVYSPNEIRKELDLPAVDGLDLNLVQTNLTDIKNLQYKEDEITSTNYLYKEDEQGNKEL